MPGSMEGRLAGTIRILPIFSIVSVFQDRSLIRIFASIAMVLNGLLLGLVVLVAGSHLHRAALGYPPAVLFLLISLFLLLVPIFCSQQVFFLVSNYFPDGEIPLNRKRVINILIFFQVISCLYEGIVGGLMLTHYQSFIAQYDQKLELLNFLMAFITVIAAFANFLFVFVLGGLQRTINKSHRARLLGSFDLHEMS
jgi:hypothetical protein